MKGNGEWTYKDSRRDKVVGSNIRKMGLQSRQRSAGLETRRTLSKLELQLPVPLAIHCKLSSPLLVTGHPAEVSSI